MTIKKSGRAIAKLVPIEPPRRVIRLGLMKGEIRIVKDFDAPLSDEVLEAFDSRSKA